MLRKPSPDSTDPPALPSVPKELIDRRGCAARVGSVQAVNGRPPRASSQSSASIDFTNTAPE